MNLFILVGVWGGGEGGGEKMFTCLDRWEIFMMKGAAKIQNAYQHV
jgi:hypothetical protein